MAFEYTEEDLDRDILEAVGIKVADKPKLGKMLQSAIKTPIVPSKATPAPEKKPINPAVEKVGNQFPMLKRFLGR